MRLLRARDPSLIAYCMEVDEKSEDSFEDKHLQIHLRIKDGTGNFQDLYEIQDSQTIITKVPEGLKMKNDQLLKKYTFSKVFGPKTTQTQIFDELVKLKLLKFINGRNSNLLTYGVSSSGKTYTVVGTPANPGVIPRALEYLFRTLPVLPSRPAFKPSSAGTLTPLSEAESDEEINIREEIINWSYLSKEKHENIYSQMQINLGDASIADIEGFGDGIMSVWVSFAEIYNEHIYDLLQLGNSKKENLKLGSYQGNSYIKNLKLVHVSSGLEAYQVLQYGLNNLNFAETKINDHSSRSHSIFTIRLVQVRSDISQDYHISHFNFCDLAGAERAKKTRNIGERLKESNSINTSLLVLGRCIAAVRKAQKSADNNIVPFRESKLTQLFQQALSGYEEISMIVNMNPCHDLFEETQHVLNFSAIAKDIVIVERPIVMPQRSDRLTQLLSPLVDNHGDNHASSEMMTKIEDLKNQLAEAVCRLEQEQLSQAREIERVRCSINAENAKLYEEFQEEMEYELLTFENELKQKNRKRLQAAKLEIMKGLRENISDLDSDDDQYPPSRTETICLDSDDEDDVAEVETIVISSDEEDHDIELDELKRKLKQIEISVEECDEIIECKRNESKRLIKAIEEQDKKIEILKTKMNEKMKKL